MRNLYLKILYSMKANKNLLIIVFLLCLTACGIPKLSTKTENNFTPESYNGNLDTNNIATESWRLFIKDTILISLIDTALKNNQELNIFQQEINMSNYEIMSRKGEYLPNLNIGTGVGVEKVGRYTSQGANDANTDIAPGKETPEPLGDFMVGAYTSWEIDIWRKLRNSRDAQIERYLSTIEGKKFLVTNLVAEISTAYYELLAQDNQLALIQEYIQIQKSALNTVKLQKKAGEVTELAVKRFEGELYSTQSLEFEIRQSIFETENKINFLMGRFPQPIQRNPTSFNVPIPESINTGLPSQLLELRPDIRQAEFQLSASKLDVKVAKAKFYPSVSLNAGVGFQAFNPAYFIQSPESMIYGLAGELAAPLLNRKAIKAEYLGANASQVQAVYNYEQAILNGFIEVSNELNRIDNLQKSYELKNKEVLVLEESIGISNKLLLSAKADYMEVLFTQRDALSARLELVENKSLQFVSLINLYRSLGGGWK